MLVAVDALAHAWRRCAQSGQPCGAHPGASDDRQTRRACTLGGLIRERHGHGHRNVHQGAAASANLQGVRGEGFITTPSALTAKTQGGVRPMSMDEAT